MAPTLPFPSALSTLIATYQTPALSSTQASIVAEPLVTPSAHDPLMPVALQVLHNLQHQHYWTALTLHNSSPFPPHARLPRPLVSGLPPQRMYVHPDDQVDELAAEKAHNAARNTAEGYDTTSDHLQDLHESEGAGGMLKRAVEREWVLPARLGEKWSLRRLAEVFDAIEEEPPKPLKIQEQARSGSTGEAKNSTDSEGRDYHKEDEESSLAELESGQPETGTETGKTHVGKAKRRGGKRVLLATVSDDSTVSYYIVHEGIVKPRQN